MVKRLRNHLFLAFQPLSQQQGQPGQALDNQPTSTMQDLQLSINALRNPNLNAEEQHQIVMKVMTTDPNVLLGFMRHKNGNHEQHHLAAQQGKASYKKKCMS